MHSDGLIPYCKDCIKKRVTKDTGEIDEDKLQNLLQQIDRPYYIDVLRSARNQYAKENQHLPPETIKYYGQDIAGLYFKNINMRQNKSKTYKDSVDTGFYRNSNNSKKVDSKSSNPTVKSPNNLEELNENNSKYVEPLIYSEKWRGKYTASDIKSLDAYYKALDQDYKIITENHRDYARKIAKASLQMDKTFDDMMNGVDGADKKYENATKVFDTLSKSAKFSESTRSVNDVGISSFSKVAAMVESHNWIPEHKPLEKDAIDELIDYLSTITKSL